MQCCVPSCNISENSVTDFVTFHAFPRNMCLRTAWLKALGKQELPDSAVVCSKHFLPHDFNETESGLRLIATDAIPSTVQVCIICLDTDSKLYLMNRYKLEEPYEKLTGQLLCEQGNLNRTLCILCAQRLLNFSRFREKCLRAHALMMELRNKHELITNQEIKTINRRKHQLHNNISLAKLGPDHCDLFILGRNNDVIKNEGDIHRAVGNPEERKDLMLAEDSKVMENDQYYDSDIDNQELNDPLTNESAEFQCKHCLKHYVNKQWYSRHMLMHSLVHNGDIGTSRLHKTRKAVSSSCSGEILAPKSARLPIKKEHKHEVKVEITKRFQSTKQTYNKVKEECVDKLCDGFIKPANGERRAQDKLLIDSECNTDTVCENFNNQEEDSRFDKIIVSKNFTNNFVENDSHKNSKFVVKHSFTCNICRCTFKYKGSLAKHMNSHSDDKPFTCKICDFKTKYKVNLSTHMKVHSKEKRYSCKICGHKCRTNSNLIEHVRTHTGEKPYLCDTCYFKCSTLSNLKKHIRTHTGDKPYSCNICQFKCTQHPNLVRHMRTHTGEKPYSCKLCKYVTAQSSHLVRHMKTHTGEKSHSCTLCNYKSITNSGVIQHMKSHSC